MAALLDIQNLRVEFGAADQPFRAVDGVSLTVQPGEVLGIVGESGSGKSVTSLALMGLIAYPGRVSADRLMFDGQDLLALPPKRRRAITGGDIAMIFQEPMTSLNPSFTVGWQIMEALKIHEGGNARGRRERAAELLAQVGIPDPRHRLGAYPHQLSGGMSQRVMIAMAIACNPKLLIADEPTTALDVTIQAQIMDLLLRLQQERGMSLILITHDLAVVAEAAHRVQVMYAGQVVETARADTVFDAPRHPYTEALLGSLPERAQGQRRLNALPGMVPGQHDRPRGCLLNPRCPYVTERCRTARPVLDGPAEHQVRCFHPLAPAASGAATLESA
ncbi:oligopeptide/dipeptide ABC transporter ATP-binding protein [Thiomonas intermedia]|uniref:oligopeptide/dipeptide ABC transporter ATP-binding protein n=1 Tax=Thiomonas intermedia TaxID=926 RepID=UPI0009A4AB25